MGEIELLLAPSGLPIWVATLLTVAELLPIMCLAAIMSIGLIVDGRKNGFTAGSWRVISFMVIVFAGSVWILRRVWF